MKTLLLLLVTASVCSLHAQEVQRQTPKAQTQQPEKMPALTMPLRLKKPNQEPVIFYSGFFVDVKRADHPFRLLSLRTPIDPKRDADTIVRPPLVNHPPAFKLFSLDF